VEQHLSFLFRRLPERRGNPAEGWRFESGDFLFAFPGLTGKIDESFRLPFFSWWRENSVFKGGTGSPSVCSQVFGQVTEV